MLYDFLKNDEAGRTEMSAVCMCVSVSIKKKCATQEFKKVKLQRVIRNRVE